MRWKSHVMQILDYHHTYCLNMHREVNTDHGIGREKSTKPAKLWIQGVKHCEYVSWSHFPIKHPGACFLSPSSLFPSTPASRAASCPLLAFRFLSAPLPASSEARSPAKIKKKRKEKEKTIWLKQRKKETTICKIFNLTFSKSVKLLAAIWSFI